MELSILRTEFYEHCTLGELSVDGRFMGHTLEGSFETNNSKGILNIQAIPIGRYEISVSYSNRFKEKLPLLSSVPYFSNVRLYSEANAIDIKGCILIGYQKHSNMVLKNKEAMKDLLEIIELELSKNNLVYLRVANIQISDTNIDPVFKFYAK